MKDMSSWYFKQPTKDLQRLRSTKILRVLKLRGKRLRSYLEMQEIKTLNFQVSRIDAVLRSREEQMKLPE